MEKFFELLKDINNRALVLRSLDLEITDSYENVHLHIDLARSVECPSLRHIYLEVAMDFVNEHNELVELYNSFCETITESKKAKFDNNAIEALVLRVQQPKLRLVSN